MSNARESKMCRGIVIVSIICCSGMVAQGKYGGGSGTPEDPYQIWDANHMQEIGTEPNDWDKCFVLMDDIDLAQYDGRDGREKFNIIAPDVDDVEDDFQGICFSGVFDGEGCVIRNLTIYDVREGQDFLGLFGKINGPNAEVKNLGLEDVDITGVGDSSYLGGLCGYNDGNISNCYSTGSISGDDYLGGLIGENDEGSVSNCYSSTMVTGDDRLGGLVGANSEGSITNCYAIGKVTGSSGLGGLIGVNGGTPVSNCFWDMDSSGQDISDGGFGRTAAQMKQAATYVGWGNGVWAIREGEGYPHLSWEEVVGATVMDNIPNRSYSGSGSPENPFAIASADDMTCLMARQEDWDKYFELVGNIHMAGVTNYLPPGNFCGRFNGNGFQIADLEVVESTFLLGLFGYLAEGSEVRNVGVVDIQVNGYRYLVVCNS